MIYTVRPKGSEPFDVICETAVTKQTHIELTKCFIDGHFYDSIVINTEDIERGEYNQQREGLPDMRDASWPATAPCVQGQE